MSDNIYKIVKLKYGIVRMRLVNHRYQIEETTRQNGTVVEGFVNNQDSSQPILQITPKKGEAKHETNFELVDTEMPKLQKELEIKPGTASRKERNGETNSERFEFKVPEVPSIDKTVKKRKTDVKSLGATSKKGKKSELPDPEMPKLQREPKIKPVRAPENHKCHPGSSQTMGKTFKKDAREQSSNFSERKNTGLKVPLIATSKVIKKSNNKKHKKGADSKKSSVQPKQKMPDEERKVDALIKYMYEAMRIGCQTPKPKERETFNVTN